MAKEPADSGSDIMDDALAMLGKDTGSELPTASEFEAAEEARLKGESPEAEVEKPEGPEKADEGEEKKEEETKPAAIDEETLATIEEKVETGAALTDEEQAALDKIKAEVEKPEPEVEKPTKTYKIAGKDVPFDEMEARYRKETGLGDLILSAGTLEKNVDMFARVQNREAAHVAVAERQKVVAQDVKQLQLEKDRVSEQKRALEQERREIELTRTRIERDRKRLEEKAKSTVTEADIEDPDTGKTNYVKLREFNAKQDAQEQLSELDQQEQEIGLREQKIQTNLVHTILTDFQLTHPQYRTSEDIREVARKINQGQAVQQDDEVRVLQMTSMLNEASTMNLSLEKVYASRKAVNQILPEVAPTTGGPKAALPNNDAKTLAEKIAKYKELQKRTLKLAGPSGGGTRGAEGKKTLGQQVMEETKYLLTKQVDSVEEDQFARSGVYARPKP
jgi:hypothetical protein